MQLLPAFSGLSQRVPYPRRPLTETERNWLWSVAITVGSVLLFGAVTSWKWAWGGGRTRFVSSWTPWKPR